jgi:hypothetical protein
MFEPFSSGYYLGRLYVQPHDGDRPAMHREQHEHVSEQLYGDESERNEDVDPADGTTTPTDSAEPTYTLGIPAEERPGDGSGEDDDDDDRPLVMKIGGAHIPVHGAPGVPEQTVALPADWLAATRVENPPTLTEVLLAKRERVDQLLKVAEDTSSGRT